MRVNEQDFMEVVHDFLKVIDSYFTSGERGWGVNPRIPVSYGGKRIEIQVRLGMAHSNIDQPKVSVEPTRRDVELRLDVPHGMGDVDWKRDRVQFLQLVAAEAGIRLKDALSKVAASLLRR